jgi:hypothetical protein
MATMPHKHTTANVVYIDATATGANNGLTPADALLTLPAFTSMVANTVYLIRRGGTYSITPGTMSSKNAVGIVAMPMPTDVLYDAIPAEAKAVWDADVAEYARINITLNATSTVFSSCKGITLWRLDIVSMQSIAQPAVPFITFTNCSMIAIEKCKSRLDGVDLTNTTTFTAAVANKILTSWTITDASGISIKSCLFERPYDLTGYNISNTFANGRGAVVQIATSRDIVVEDCDIVYAFPGHSCALPTNGAALSVDTIGKENAVIHNVRFKGVEIRDSSLTYEAYGYSWMTALSYIASRGVISDITVTMKKIGTYPTPTNTWSGCQSSNSYYMFMAIQITNLTTDDVTSMYGVDVSNVNIDYTGVNFIGGGIALAASWATTRSVAYGGRYTLKNYTLTAPGTIAVGNDNSAVFTSLVAVTGLGVGQLPACDIEDVAIHYTGAFMTAMDLGMLGAVGTAAPWTSDSDYGGGITVKGASVTGQVIACMGYVELDSSTIPVLTSYNAVYATGSAQVYVDNLVLPAGWTSSDEAVFASQNAQVMVNNVNRVASWAGAVNAMVNNHVAVSNADGVAGAWRSATGYARVQTVTVYRTGGAAAALYVNTPTTPTRLCGPWLAPFPYAPKQLDPGGTGLRLLTVYIAVKGFATVRRNIFAAIQIIIEAPAGAYPKTRQYLSSSTGWMESDLTSVWNNDTGLTAYKIVVPFKVDRYENIGVRVHFMPVYENAAFYYVDPKFVVSAG